MPRFLRRLWYQFQGLMRRFRPRRLAPASSGGGIAAALTGGIGAAETAPPADQRGVAFRPGRYQLISGTSDTILTFGTVAEAQAFVTELQPGGPPAFARYLGL